MRITRRRLRMIIREERARLLTKNCRKLSERSSGDIAMDELRSEDLMGMIRDYSKELTGRRDTYGSFDRLEHLSAEELEDYYNDMSNSPEAQDLAAKFQGEEDAILGHEEDLTSMERSPRRQGMSRRPAGKKAQRRMESNRRKRRSESRHSLEKQIRRIVNRNVLK